MPRGLKVSRPLIAKMIQFVNIVKKLSEKIFTLFHLVYHIGILEKTLLHFNMQGGDIIEYTNDKYRVNLHFSLQEEDRFL